jgi:hypothetical protein
VSSVTTEVSFKIPVPTENSVELEYPEEFPESVEVVEGNVEYATSLQGEYS